MTAKQVIGSFFATVLLFCSSLPSIAQDRFEMTVSQDGKGDFVSIQAAIDACKAFPDRRITIYIRNGIYQEKVKVPACNTRLSLIGESADNTILVWDDHFNRINRGRNSTFYTYTLMVEADDFTAENLTVANSAGSVGQAVALHVEGDRCVFRNCRFVGHQDTLYLAGRNNRLYFTGCHIEGTTDFIFGAATVLFDQCILHSKGNSYITAASTPEGKSFGFVFRGCRLTAREGIDRVFLGRPWRNYARTVFIGCELGSHIVPEGWSNWNDPGREKTAFYAEYGNTGPGAGTAQRVHWCHQLTKRKASGYIPRRIFAPVLPGEPTPEIWMTGTH